MKYRDRLALIALLSIAAIPGRAAEPVVLVLPFKGADPTVADGMRAAIITSVPRFTVVSTATTSENLAAAEALGLHCDSSVPACALQLGGLAAADVVITGTVTSGVTAGTALDVARERSRHAEAPSGELKLLAVRLLAPEREVGRIVVTAQPAGANVFIDGLVRGSAPRTLELKPGKHEVYVGRVGYESQTHLIDVVFDAEVRVDVTLVAGKDNKPPPFALEATATDAPAPERKKGFLRVAVYDLEATDVPPRVPRIVTQALLQEIRKLEGISVVGLDEIKAMLDFEAKKQLAGCVDESCLADIAGALGADIIVVGTLAHVGNGSVFGVRRLDPRTAQVSGNVAQRLEDAGGEEFIAAVGPIIEQLFPDFPLLPGAVRGADPELALRVHPPPLQPWVFWSTTAGAGTIALATIGAGAVNLAAYTKYERTPPDQATLGREVVENENLAFVTGVSFWVGVGLTTALATTAAVASLFTDWRRYGDELPPTGLPKLLPAKASTSTSAAAR